MSVSDKTKAANLARAFNVAAPIVAASPDLGDATPQDVAAAVAELAAALYAEQNALFEGEQLGDVAPAKPASGGGGGKSWSGGSTSSTDPATDKQIGYASNLIREIQEKGGTPPHDIDDVKGMTKAEASDAISQLKTAAEGDAF